MANPTLVAVSTLMLLLPNPKRLMLGYLLGALMTSITLGLIIVFAGKNSSVASSGKTTINPVIDLGLGVILLVIALVLHQGRDQPIRERRAERKAGKEPKTPRWQQYLSKGDPKITFVIGAVLTLPGASYIAALDGIIKLKASTLATVLLVLMVNVIMLALLEVPLICFTVAPDWTPAAIERTKAWFRRHGRKTVIIGAATLGALLILRGVIELIAA
ncbi:MAG: GAP family protein [Solirubrobacterales bacterium]|nr:GAP family protein [Solirubrobacterales bacterium]MBV9799453.1 GAP family protein [Solirubrobacterales bacterium]